MKVERGASQILFGFLPGQTVDLNGGVWRVTEWNEPRPLDIDQTTLRSTILEQTVPWRVADRHDGLCNELFGGLSIDAVRLNEREGIDVEPFPAIWRCRGCNRLLPRSGGKCGCGSESRHQLHYVQFHACGLLQEPTLPRCKAHGQVAMRLPGSAAVKDIPFFCPVCHQSLGLGFPFRNCSCGIDPIRLERNVHRAASVFTPRFVSVINPRDPATAARIRAAGGGARALEWVLDGMQGDEPMGGPQTAAGLIDTLVRSGIPIETAHEMARLATDKGVVSESKSATDVLPATVSTLAQDEAFAIAAAVMEGRVSVETLSTKSGPPLQTLYETAYPPGLDRAGLESIDLLPRFPVATLAFGYTRGDPTPGASRLNAFRIKGLPRAYGTLQPTEGLLFRIDPLKVHAWLARIGVPIGPARTKREARLAILSSVELPRPGGPIGSVLGQAVVELIHSYAHRVIRTLSAFAGIERDGLSEYLLPHHLGFVVYAASRGFVLGGLQAVFETSLHRFLSEAVGAEARCALDPGCRSNGSACMACLHLGEASCRWFNTFLTRRRLFGAEGFWR